MQNDSLPSRFQVDDPWLFGWDATPGIVSVWADREGRALIWRRLGEEVVCETSRYRPWLYAAHLEDLPSTAKIARDDETAPFSYRELEGEAPSLRYLISAHDGRALERRLLEGARKRLNREIPSLNSLDDYYQVGPVEQYLMQTGRNYFRELSFAALRRLQFDLETTTLSPKDGRIFMVAVRDSQGLETVLEAPRTEDEPGLIRGLMALIQERDPDVIENHNLMGFDLPFLAERARVHRIRLELGRAPGPRELVQLGVNNGRKTRGDSRYSVAGREMLDTLDATWRVDFVVRALPSHSLKDVARFFGVALRYRCNSASVSADRVYLEGRRVYETYCSDPEQVKCYALQDVGEVDAIAQRLHAPPFALACITPRRYERVAYAGTATGILEPMLVRAYYQAQRALPRSAEATSDQPHAGGAVMLFATGIAERVVKADIASLYPSLIRTYRIGPRCDALGAFVHLVDRLTGLRLEYKAAALRAEKGSLVQGEYEAMQAAMKLVINSAYGYLGAGRIARFADREAADQITRRGREILEQVCRELQRRGATLIEADTDGVYFGVPPGWDEARERALVHEVGATLPKGLHLEFDGRYRAMFSHEVKNYALLDYDGRLVVRGGALRSSRSEPFAEAWLKQALLLLLQGDVPGVRRSFLKTVAGLEARQYALEDVAIRVRTTKNSEQYAASSRSEAIYEALLNSGYQHWSKGEKVRIYRANNGQWRLLGEVESNRDYDVRHYVQVLRESYAERLRKAFNPQDFEQLFRLDRQPGLFDRALKTIRPLRAGLHE